MYIFNKICNNISNILNNIKNNKYIYIPSIYKKNNIDINLKKYILDSTYKSVEKYKTDKSILDGFQIYSNLSENNNPNNILSLFLGILGFSIMYKYIKH